MIRVPEYVHHIAHVVEHASPEAVAIGAVVVILPAMFLAYVISLWADL